MSRMRLSLLLALVVAPGLADAQNLTLKNEAIILPDRGTQFSGPGAEVVNDNCLTCHSAGMVLNQPTMPAAAWRAEAEKMIHIYKAPIDENDVAAIVGYLAARRVSQ